MAAVFCQTWRGRFYHNKLCCHLSWGLGKQMTSIQGWKIIAPLGKIANQRNSNWSGVGHKKAVEDRTEWRTKAEHTQKKEGRKEPLGKVFKTHLSFRWAFAELKSTKTQCRTMISMNVTDSLSILSVSALDWFKIGVLTRSGDVTANADRCYIFMTVQVRQISVDH